MPINHDMMHAQSHGLFEKSCEVFEGVAKLKERIAELEKDNERLENAVDVYKSNADVFKCQVAEISMKLYESQKKSKSTRLALWLARAERARVESIYWLNLMYEEKWSAVKFTVKRKHGENVKPDQTTRNPENWFNIWDVVELYCKHKAEEYK